MVEQSATAEVIETDESGYLDDGPVQDEAEQVTEPASETTAEPESAQETTAQDEVSGDKPPPWLKERLEREREKNARELDELRRENESLRSQVPKSERPTIPAVPDPYDFDSDDAYRQAIENRDAKVKAAAEWDAREQFRQEQEQEQVQRQQQDAQRQQQEYVNSFFERGQKAEIAPQDLQNAMGTLGQIAYPQNGVEQQNWLGFAGHIMGEEDGPQVMKFMADHPELANQVATAAKQNPYAAVSMLERQIRPAMAEMKPRTSNAPEPTETLDGSGVNAEHPLLEGAIFE